MKKVTIATLLFLTFFISLSIFINSYTFFKLYSEIKESVAILPKYRLIEHFPFEIDFSKALLRRGFKTDKDTVNISLSAEDIKSFQSHYYNSISKGTFLPDRGNDWRKAKIQFPFKEEQKIKTKIHGTSVTPVLNSLSFTNYFKNRFFKDLSEDMFDISRGGFAFKVKIRSEDDYYNGIRRLNFLSPKDDWTIASNSLNKYFNSIDVITTYGHIKKLHINGTQIGPYLQIEQIGKELLERNYNITNYASLKTNDDWDKGKGNAHISNTDYNSQDREQAGEEETIPIAQFQLDRLLKALERKDIEIIKSLIDLENIAKISALVYVTGQVHPVTGDNPRLIYDFSTGKFRLTFRLEGKVTRLLDISPDQFDKQTFDYPIHLLLKTLLEHSWFRQLRNKNLISILEDKEKIEALIENDFNSGLNLFSEILYPTNYFEYTHREEISNLEHNFNVISRYLNYAKVYLTVEKLENGSSSLNFLHDSYTPSYISSIDSCEGKRYLFNPPYKLNTMKYSDSGFPIKNDLRQEIVSPFDCVSQFLGFKDFNKVPIEDKHKYINYSSKITINNESGLLQFGTKLEKKDSDSKFYLKSGTYLLTQDVIFPIGASLEIEPGVLLKMDPQVSIFLRGSLKAIGTKQSPIKVFQNRKEPFGTFAILGSSLNRTSTILKNFHIAGGNEEILQGIYFSSQMSIHNAEVLIESSSFKDSFSDDGLNIKNSKVQITGNTFQNNFADQVDLDYTQGIVEKNKFLFSKPITNNIITDGLDVSGSSLVISENLFENMSDKGLSVGEKSRVIVDSNTFSNNHLGIAVKDSSKICINSNYLLNNKINISSYIKKKIYSLPKIFIAKQEGVIINFIRKEKKNTNVFNVKKCTQDLIFN